MQLKGIDVAYPQGIIDWRLVKKDNTFFAGIRASQGNYVQDNTFWHNWNGAYIHGVRRIAYHYFDPAVDGNIQANYMHQFVHDSGRFIIGDAVMLDIEQTSGVDVATLVYRAEQFVTNILRLTHCGLYIYSAPYFWNDVLGGPRSKILSRCASWIATWGPAPGQLAGWPNGASIWQYGLAGTVPGINGDVDGDVFFGTPKQYDILSKQAGRH